MTGSPKKTEIVFVSLMAAAWLILSGYLLFTFQTADQVLFDARVTSSQDDFSVEKFGAQLDDLIGELRGPVLIVALDLRCACTQAVIDHLRDLEPMLVSSGVAVQLLSPNSQAREAKTLAENLKRETGLNVKLAPNGADSVDFYSSPAAAVLNDRRELVYYGPWSAGGACVAGVGGFVESAIKALDSNDAYTIVNRAAVGCYCRWGRPDRGRPDWGRPDWGQAD